MNKRFFLAAFAAAAFTMGFTACSEDENVPEKGNYKMEGCLNIANRNIDSTEYKHIMNVYSQALGTSNEEGDFTIKGKDSLDCVSNIKKCCEQAEAKLAGETWSGAYNTQVLIENYKTILYEHQYGKPAENDDIYRAPVQLQNESDVPAPENTFVTGFSIQNNGHSKCDLNIWGGRSEWIKTVWHSNKILNSSDYNKLYLCMQVSNYTRDEVKTMVKNDDSRLNELVGDVMVLYFYKGNFPKEFTYNGAKYEVCGGGTMGEKDPIDLNLKSGGPYMYLYVSHDVKHFNRVLDGYDAAFFYSDDNFFFNNTWGVRKATSQLVQGVYQDEKGNLSNHYEDGMDFQKGTGTGSYFIKLRLNYVPLNELKGE